MQNLDDRQREFLDKLFTLTNEYKDASVTAIGQGLQNTEYVVLVYIRLGGLDCPIHDRRKYDRRHDDCEDD